VSGAPRPRRTDKPADRDGDPVARGIPALAVTRPDEVAERGATAAAVNAAGALPASRFLEVGALVHRQPLEIAAQAIESQLDRAQPHPLATADDAAPA
jgi:hypothetical protein